MIALNIIALGVAGLILGLSLIIFLECVAAALAPLRQKKVATDHRPPAAILMPAHNESAILEQTLTNLQPHLLPQDQLVVVADNCADNTAEIARMYNAIVLERHSENERGKGYALDYGLKYLQKNPPQIVVILDADCTLEENALDELVRWAHALNAPIQAIYLLDPPQEPTPKDRVSAFAFQVKNLARPLGLHKLGQPCLLTGTGMAFPWSLISAISVASGNIVEDMQLGLDLALAGNSPQLAPTALAYGGLPKDAAAASSQRTRWEHGHMQTLLTQVPRLLSGAIRQGRLDLLALALELSVPPLSFLMLLWVGAMAFTMVAGIMGAGWEPFLLSSVAGILIFVGIGVAWAKFSRKILPFSALLSVPTYILWKIPLYLKFLVRPQQSWVRTKRDGE